MKNDKIDQLGKVIRDTKSFLTRYYKIVDFQKLKNHICLIFLIVWVKNPILFFFCFGFSFQQKNWEGQIVFLLCYMHV